MAMTNITEFEWYFGTPEKVAKMEVHRVPTTTFIHVGKRTAKNAIQHISYFDNEDQFYEWLKTYHDDEYIAFEDDSNE